MRNLRTPAHAVAVAGLLALSGCVAGAPGTAGPQDTAGPHGTVSPVPIELEPDPPCAGVTSQLVDSSTVVVNAFALLDSDPQAALAALEEARSAFRESATDLDDASSPTVTAYDDALTGLVEATTAAVDDGAVDAAAVTAATSRFEADARAAAALCTPDATPGATAQD